MEIKLDENKQVLAYRVKLEKSEEHYFKNKGIISIIFASIAFLPSLLFIIVTFFSFNKNRLSIAIVLFILALYLSLIGVLSLIKYSQQIKITSYPQEAVILDRNKLLILTDKVTEIDLSDIESVYSRQFIKINLFFYSIYDYGNLKINLKNKKGSIGLINIAYVNNACSLIKSVLDK